MAAVLIIISIMEFLQEGRLERIRNVRSFDTVVEGDFTDEISALYPDFEVFSYGEADALISGHAARIRFIDDDYDGGVMMLGGEMDSLVVSYPMLFSLSDSHSASVMPVLHALSRTYSYMNWFTPNPSKVDPRP